MKESVAGARGQSADGNYRRPYESGQLRGGREMGKWGVESSEKRRLEGGISGFWWFLVAGFRSFRRKRWFWVWYDDCNSKSVRDQAAEQSLTDGCLEPAQFTGKGM
jgi:hypothetical protein